MSNDQKWRIAHFGEDDQLEKQFIAAFEQAYLSNGKPKNMAMFSHVDSLGRRMALSITPESNPYCPFSADWDEWISPTDFGNLGWVAGDKSVRRDR
jgi:hypothetical protein